MCLVFTATLAYGFALAMPPTWLFFTCARVTWGLAYTMPTSRCTRVRFHKRGYGATVARLTPDQKVGSSNLSALIFPEYHLCCACALRGDRARGGGRACATLRFECGYVAKRSFAEFKPTRSWFGRFCPFHQMCLTAARAVLASCVVFSGQRPLRFEINVLT